MASGAAAPGPAFGEFARPPKHPVPKEKDRFAWLPLLNFFFLDYLIRDVSVAFKN